MSVLVVLMLVGAVLVVGSIAAIVLDPLGRWVDRVVGVTLVVGVVLLLGPAYYLAAIG